MQSRLLLVVFFLGIVHCDIIKDSEKYVESLKIYNDLLPFECTLSGEKAENTIDYILRLYPSLKPSDKLEVIRLKKSFQQFLTLSWEFHQQPLISGKTDEIMHMKHTVLARFLKGLREIAEDEFEDLSEEEQAYLETVDLFVQHKLIIAPGLKDIKEKRSAYLKSKMSKKDFAEEIKRKCSAVAKKWSTDPDYNKVEEIDPYPEMTEVLRKHQDDPEDEPRPFYTLEVDREKNTRTFKREL